MTEKKESNPEDRLDALIESNEKISSNLQELISTPGSLDLKDQEVQSYNQQFSPEVVEMARVLLTRRQLQSLMGESHEGERDVYKVCGYRKDLDFEHYQVRYDRQDIAGRIVDAPPQATWRREPEIVEIRPDEGGEEEEEQGLTPFEAAWKKVVKNIRVYHYLERVDRLSGIGRYGVLLIGVAGEKPLSEPLEKNEFQSLKTEGVVFLSAYKEQSADIDDFIKDTNDPKFGEPARYEIDLLGDLASSSEVSESERKVRVHPSRVIHVAEGKLEDEVFGQPRLKRVYNRLMDMEKIAGGSGEMFWQGARLGLHVDVQPGFALGDLAGNMDSSFDTLQTELDEYFHGLRRFIRTRGANLNPLGTQVADPKNHFEIILTLISGSTGIPRRILVGSERGELASTQDEANWNARVKERQTTYAQPEILEMLIGRLQWLGVLPETPLGYEVRWPSLFEEDKKDEADIALKKSTALKNYTDDPQTVVDPDEFRDWIALPPMTDEQKQRLGIIEEPLPEEGPEGEQVQQGWEDLPPLEDLDIRRMG